MPISDESVAGHVAKTGEILHLEDAYAPPAGAPFKINRSFDQQAGYRTKSMLVVPMRTPAGETIGVLQLINCKRVAARRFPSVEAIERETIPYPERFMSFAASLASQAAVALQNSRLLENIQALFEGFVNASVTAIESRDPTTSGHSFRVADLTVALAAAADRADARAVPRRSASPPSRCGRSATPRCSTTSARSACARRCWSRPRSSTPSQLD